MLLNKPNSYPDAIPFLPTQHHVPSLPSNNKKKIMKSKRGKKTQKHEI